MQWYFAMGRFSRGSVLLLILLSTVSVVYYSKRCHCYKFQRISYSKRGSKFIPQRTLSESATRSRSTEHAGRQNIRFNRQRKTEKFGITRCFSRNVFVDRSEELRAHASHPTSLQACSPCLTIKPGCFDDCTGG